MTNKRGYRLTPAAIWTGIGILALVLAFLLASCAPAPTDGCIEKGKDICNGADPALDAPETEHVCYGDPEQIYDFLDQSPRPVLYQGREVSWVHFTDAKIYASQYGGPASPISNTALIEGLEYTIEIQLKVKANTMGVLRMKGFVCGGKFYFYLIEEANPFFIG